MASERFFDQLEEEAAKPDDQGVFVAVKQSGNAKLIEIQAFINKYALDIDRTTTDTSGPAITRDVAEDGLTVDVNTNPTSVSTAIKAAIMGNAVHISSSAIEGAGHNIGVFGRADNEGSGLVALAIGVEGRVDSLVGNITSGAAFTAAFGEDGDMAGTVAIGVGYFMPDQTDDAHIISKFAFLNNWADASVKTLGKVEIGKDIDFDATIALTTGNQTINKSAGRVTIAAAANTLTVTNSLVAASSIVILTLAELDATAFIPVATAGAGSFTVTMNANATADTDVNFLVVN